MGRQATASVGTTICVVGGVQPGPGGQRGTRAPGPGRPGSKALRGALGKAGQAAGQTRTYLGATYHILKTSGTVYADLGADNFAARDRAAAARRELHRLEALGYRVTLEPATPAAAG